MLESKEITKAFGSKNAVDHISLLLERGHVYAMLGPNGSGKTTWMTVKDVGAYYADFFDDFSWDGYRAMLRQMELEEGMKTKTLSSGMMAKLKIAVTMARDARVYMLDEPFNGIDLLARDNIRRCILEHADESKVLLLSSHLVEEMEAIADKAVFIRQGKLMEVDDLEEMRVERGASMADRYREIYGHTEE